jgi:ribosomal protein S18 acetylase RimI-like enzyme
MNITIRHSLPSDIPSIVSFNIAMARETEEKELDTRTVERGVKAIFENSERGFYLLAEDDGAAAGCLLITNEWSDWRNGYFWWIQSVFVKPDYRRQGVYTRLHRFVETMARKQPAVRGIRLYVDKTNSRAQAVYRSLGMTPARYDLFEKEF